MNYLFDFILLITIKVLFFLCFLKKLITDFLVFNINIKIDLSHLIKIYRRKLVTIMNIFLNIVSNYFYSI